MNKLLKILALALLPLASVAQNCDINLTVLPMMQGDGVPANITDNLVTRLTQVVTANGVTAEPYYNRFFVAGKFNHQFKDVTTTAPVQTIIKTMLTVYIGDSELATESFDLQGVGQNFDRAYISALSRINARNEKFKAFIEAGKKKILDYYDNHSQQIITKAESAASMQNFGEALYYLSAVPECSKAFEQTKKSMLSIYQRKIDFEGKVFLQKAQAAWNANPTAGGAAEAVAWLNEINPESSAYPAAVKLGEEIRKTTRSDIDFEVRQKYHDAVELEKLRIEAARQIGKAYGEGQKEQTTNLMWMR